MHFPPFSLPFPFPFPFLFVSPASHITSESGDRLYRSALVILLTSILYYRPRRPFSKRHLLFMKLFTIFMPWYHYPIPPEHLKHIMFNFMILLILHHFNKFWFDFDNTSISKCTPPQTPYISHPILAVSPLVFETSGARNLSALILTQSSRSELPPYIELHIPVF